MQKLDKPVELEGRVIRYKPIVKRNNQIGGALQVGDHIRCLSEKMKEQFPWLFIQGNRWIVKKINPETIIAQHISSGLDWNILIDNVEKIDSNSDASAASATSATSDASAASSSPPNYFPEFKQQIISNNNDNNWEFAGKPESPVIAKRPNNSAVMVQRPNSNSPVLFPEENLIDDPDFHCEVYGSRTKDGFLYECPECHATTSESNYNKTGIFPHKKGCSNIGKYCSFVVSA